MKPVAVATAALLLLVCAFVLFANKDLVRAPAPDINAPKGMTKAPLGDVANDLVPSGTEDPRDLPHSDEPAPPPPDAIAFEGMPAAHHPSVVLSKVRAIGESLQEQFPSAGVEMLQTECESAPCILGLDYDAAAAAAGPGGARAFHQGIRATFEAQLGYPVTSMHVDEIEGGKQIWMFAVPVEVDKANPLRNQLIETGHHRHARLLDAEEGAPETDEEKAFGEIR